MVTAISRQRSRPRLGPVASLTAAAQGLALVGLMVAGLALLAVLLAAVGLPVVGVGVLIADRGLPGIQRAELAMLLIGGGSGVAWSVEPGTLLAIRRLAMLTRRLAGEWCGVPIDDPYRPLPAGEAKLGFARRTNWLLTDPATWRDLRWVVSRRSLGRLQTCYPPL
jgi:Putative sensor